MFKSLRISLTLLFVGLTVLPLLVAGPLIASRGYETLEAQSFKLQEQVARQTSISLAAFFNERQNELETLTQVYGLDTLPVDAQRDVLLALLSKQPAYYQLSMIQADGQETLRLTRGEFTGADDPVDRSNDPLFQAAVKNNRVSYSEVHFNEDARDRLVTIAVPIQDLFTGNINAVLSAEIRFQNVAETLVRNFDFAQGDDVFIVDGNGVVIAHRNPGLVLKETVFNLPAEDGRYPGLSGDDAIIDLDKVTLGDVELIVVAEASYANATALATDSTRLAALVTVVTLLIAGIIVALAVNRVVNPIIKLSRVANAIQAGDFSQQTNISRKDEIGQFAAAFNAMSSAIQKREADLRHQADELRIATFKAKEAARIKGEFLATISHELRTPLNAIIGFSDMLLMGMSGELTDKQKHKVERLKENGNRLLTLINNVLDLTRIEARRIEITNKPFDPRTLAQRLTTQVEVLPEKKALEFKTIIAPDLPSTVVGDEERIEQVVLNLLSNAFKFTDKGSVTLEISANPADKQWYLAVTDTGIGIPPHALDIIFEEFRQVDGGSARAYKGSGLGLAITRNLVRIMDGQITVKSEPGVGSTFTVTLPLKPEIEFNQPTLEKTGA